MSGLLRGTSESVIDVVTNVRVIYGIPEWNTGGIDVRHFERVSSKRVLGILVGKGRELSIKIEPSQQPFISSSLQAISNIAFWFPRVSQP